MDTLESFKDQGWKHGNHTAATVSERPRAGIYFDILTVSIAYEISAFAG